MEYSFEKPSLIDRYTEIGGGEGYNADNFLEDKFDQGAGWTTGNRITSDDADTVVETANAFATAISESEEGETIYIPGDATLTLRNTEELNPAKNVTIASGRGYDGDGALLDVDDANPLINIFKEGVRVTGIRFQFPVTERIEWPGYNSGKISKAVVANANNVEVDNCVFRGCGHAGVGVGFSSKVKGTHIHHNDFVDNPMGGLGYGVTIQKAEPLIQYNYFDNNRHAIAASGAIDCYYVARYNFVGGNPRMHCFDMHEHKLTEQDMTRLREKYDNFDDEFDLTEGDLVGGRRLSIHHNIFAQNNVEAVKVRAEPLDGAQIDHNWLFHPEPPEGTGTQGDAFRLTHSNSASLSEAGIRTKNNVYGEGGPDDVGIPSNSLPPELRKQLEKRRSELDDVEKELSARQKTIEEQAESISTFSKLLERIKSFGSSS